MSGTSSTLRPRRHLHQGTVRASAFWFDPMLLGEGEARRRVLAAWTPGSAVLALAGGYLLRLPRPCAVASDSSPGLPLTLEQGVLSSAPLSTSERAHPELREGTVVLVRAGVASVASLAGARAVDLSEWLDVSAWVTLPVRGLGAPPPPVSVLEPVRPPTRELFGPAVPTLAPEAQVMLARMQGRPPPEGLAVPPRPGLLARLRAAFGGKALGDAARAEGGARAPGLLRRLFGSPGGSASGSTSSGAGGPGLLARLAAWFQRGGSQPSLPSGAPGGASGMQRASASSAPRAPSWLGRWLAALFGGSEQESGGPTTPTRGDSGAAPRGTQAPPPGPGMLSRLSEWMLRNTPLGELLGRRKAEYVRRLFDMFEEGNLQEALRYAIPLGANLDENTRVSLGLPGPRESLSIQPAKGGAASVFGGGEDLFAALKERYRDAFRRYEREGRIDEAAFILAELLGAHEEAVSFLERHERFKLAAELAEGRGLAPGLVVRQLFLAKDVARAMAVARRSGAFADAVLRLERTHPREARALRLLWGDALADSGDWARAVQAVWPLSEARELARGWVERGVACGGASGARLLALWVTAFPDGLPAAEARVRELLEDDSLERAPERHAFALTLAGESPSAGRTALVVPTVRALLRDRAAGGALFASDFLTRLLRDAPDGALRTDLPPLSERVRTAWSSDPSRAPVHATVRATDEGAFPVHDAVALPDGRLLLALGEAGARLVRADGRTVAHFDVPAFALVPSIHGDRALALAPRGEVRRLSRLDLVARRASSWCDAPLDAWAPTYDGSVWFTAVGSTVMMVDALATGLRALWRVTDVPGPVRALAVDSARLSFLSANLERWTYDLPQGPTLRDRGEMAQAASFLAGTLLSASLTADGEAVVMAAIRVPDRRSTLAEGQETGLTRLETQASYLRPTSTRKSVPPGMLHAGRAAVFLSEAWRVDMAHAEGHWRLYLSDARDTMRGQLTFEGDAQPRLRLTATALLAFDARGRLLWVDLEEGTARHVAVQ
ncbi:bpX6 domain-containing protein [Pyxidicoccus trucidator]|uniref:bpX6 domain-containing protein n=1 Tax=Pyxidicoccus trucidator TaxID=2709662 RepID=UPI0013DBE009|nr:bpX6 domain-containing protein [Pyxidicoccus trucidator]